MGDSWKESSNTDLRSNNEENMTNPEKTSTVTFSSQHTDMKDKTSSDDTGTITSNTVGDKITDKTSSDKTSDQTISDKTTDKTISDKTTDKTISDKGITDKTLTDLSVDMSKNTARTARNSSSSSNPLESSGISNNSFTDTTTFLSSSTTFTDTDVEKSRNITKDLIVRKQLLHDVQRLKIELSQKTLLIDTLKADHLNVIDDLEDKLSDAIHQKQLLQAKVETQVRMMQSEHNKEVKRLKSELQESLCLQREFKGKYQEISTKSVDMKTAFIQKDLDEEEYFGLKGKSVEELSATEYFNVRLYDSVHPLRVQVESLEQRINLLTSDLRDREDELSQQKKLYEDESYKRAELDIRCQRFQVQVEDLRSQVSRDTYRNQNYDTVQGERDSLERKIVDLEKTCIVYKTELEGKANELEGLRNKTVEQTQSHALLKQDKEYLSRQLNELVPRHNVLEERFEQVSKQLDEAKHAREELYEKYLNSREHYKQEYESRMKRELDELTTKTNNELERIKESTKEMYEMENRTLRENKSNAIAEQDRLSSSEKEIQAQYNRLLGEYRQLQVVSDSRISELQNEAKLKSFELDRVQLLYEESLKNNKEAVMQSDLLSKRFETLNKEYYGISASSDKRITELEAKNEEYRSKLKIYEKLEQELDDVVMQAAEVTDEGDAERVLFAYGYGANIPSTAKRRMQQSVQLARRVLHLERANTSLRHDIERETKKTQQLGDELKKTTGLLNEAQQPYNYLIGSIQTRDEHNEAMKKTITTLEDDLKKTLEENNSLRMSHDQMSADLERLLNQREEMSMLKQVVLNMKSSSADNSLQNISRTSSTVYGPHVSKRTSSQQDDIKTVKGNPVSFTKSTPPAWYEKLKRQNQMKEYSKSSR